MSELKNKKSLVIYFSRADENYAVELYKKLGFKIIDENKEEYIMSCYL